MFSVAGQPQPQGSKRAFLTRTGKINLVESAGQRLKVWRAAVTAEAISAKNRARLPTFREPVEVEIRFAMRRPAHPKFALPGTKPDSDKCARAILDAVTDARVWVDDSLVTDLIVRQRYATGAPGATIGIRPANPAA